MGVYILLFQFILVTGTLFMESSCEAIECCPFIFDIVRTLLKWVVLSLTASSLPGNSVGTEDGQLKLQLIIIMMDFFSFAFSHMLQWRNFKYMF